MTDLAARLIFAMERLDTSSAAVLRHASYKVLEELGVDVRRLVTDARQQIIAERRAAAERSQNALERLRERAARVPELQALVANGPAAPVREKVRELLAAGKKPVEIAIALELDVRYVRAVRDLDLARAAKAKLTQHRKQLPRRHWERLARIARRVSWGGPTNGPTKERKRQLGEGEELVATTVAGEQQLFRREWPVDQIRGMLSDAAYLAAQRLRDAWDGMEPSIRSSAFDGRGTAGNPSARLGLTPEQERCGVIWRGLWTPLPSAVRLIVRNFVLERSCGGAERPLSFVEYGRRYGVKGPDQARGIAQGALATACEVLAQAARQFAARERARERTVYAEMMAEDVARWVRDAAAAPEGSKAREEMERAAVVELLRRIEVEHWIVRRCVRRAIRAAERIALETAPAQEDPKTAASASHGFDGSCLQLGR